MRVRSVLSRMLLRHPTAWIFHPVEMLLVTLHLLFMETWMGDWRIFMPLWWLYDWLRGKEK